ncbi:MULTISPECIES: SMP-30/gluconolactonase/LRE family protein [Streptomyces]|uniref:SMP-30/gluconolactonase/LRE family protein n=1 Tax=Streptomyces TaxID=1883 RepID=UPI0036C7AB10
MNGVEHGFALLCGRRPFAVAPDGPGRPDGLTVDAEGGVRAALYDGGAVHRYAPDGTLDDVFVREFAG